MATKSGTNRFSGEVFEFFRDKSLNAFDRSNRSGTISWATPKPDYTRHSYGGALGGPIIRDRLHFFAAFEKSSEKATATANTGQPQFYSALEGSFARTYNAGRGSCAAISRSTRSSMCSSGMSRTWRGCSAKPAAASTRHSRLRRALAARFEPGRPHVGDRLADAERDPGDCRPRTWITATVLRDCRSGTRAEKASSRPSGSRATRRSSSSRA